MAHGGKDLLNIQEVTWNADLEAFMHATNSIGSMFDTSPNIIKVTYGDGNGLKTFMQGKKQLAFIQLAKKLVSFTLQEVYYMPGP